MPSKSVKQAKTMSAIAHGWQPTGEAADIPVSVAKDFHAADKGKKFGKGGKKGNPTSNPSTPPATGKAPPMGAGETKGDVDRSSHFKGNPGFPSGETGGGGLPKHASQPQGHPIGVPPLGNGQPASFGSPSTFRGMRGNPTPSSGHPGAHRIGSRRK